MKNTKLAYLTMVIVITLWGFAWPVGRIVATSNIGMYPFTISFLRYLFTLPVLILFTKIVEGKIHYQKHLTKQFIILGLFQITLYQLFFLLGVRYTSSSDAVLIINGGLTIITAILSSKVYSSEKLDRYRIVGIILAFSGVLLIFLYSPNIDTENRILGNFYILLAAIAFSIYTVYSKPIYKEVSPLNFQIWATFYGWLILSIFSIGEMISAGSILLNTIDLEIYLWILYLGVGAAAIGNTLYSVGVKKIGPTRASIFINLMPIFGIAASVILLNEKMTIIYPIAFLIVLAGIIVERKSNKENVQD